jgi:acetyl-CoA carboxylase carboxyl transferase subunit alpha
VIDRVVKEPDGGAHRDVKSMAAELKRVIYEELDYLQHLNEKTLVERRQKKFLNMGHFSEDSA